ncbi:MAG: hypothetical protein AB1646_12080, partial [Thermodesulfobacteriota bacterium]
MFSPQKNGWEPQPEFAATFLGPQEDNWRSESVPRNSNKKVVAPHHSKPVDDQTNQYLKTFETSGGSDHARVLGMSGGDFHASLWGQAMPVLEDGGPGEGTSCKKF